MFNKFNIFEAWNDYYKTFDTPKGNHFYSGHTFDTESLNISSRGNTYIFNCYFSYLSAKDGGVILNSVLHK